MRLMFHFQPVDDVAAAADHYRGIGWAEAWREGEHTIAMQMPEVDTQLMLDDEPGWGASGPMYAVDDVARWQREHPEVLSGPLRTIPGGAVTAVTAPGHTYYVFSMHGDD